MEKTIKLTKIDYVSFFHKRHPPVSTMALSLTTNVDRTKANFDRDKAKLDRAKAKLDRAKATIDRAKATIDRAKAQLKAEQDTFEQDKAYTQYLLNLRKAIKGYNVYVQARRAAAEQAIATQANTDFNVGAIFNPLSKEILA